MSVSCEQMDNGCKHVIISLCDMQLVHLLVMDAERIIKARFSTVLFSRLQNPLMQGIMAERAI